MLYVFSKNIQDLFFIVVEKTMRRSPSTPVSWQRLQFYLRDHPDRDLVNWCVDGFRNGFSLELTADPAPWPDPPNSKRVRDNPQVTWKLIKDEIDKGSILGPFKQKPRLTKPLLCVPIQIIEKQMSSGLYRLVQDFSYPYDTPHNGINALVPPDKKKINFAGMDDVARMAVQLQNSWAVKLDIKSAFKCLPLRYQEWFLTGFQFQGAFFIQTQIPFGAAASCRNFELCMRLLEWIIKNEYPPALITHYLDDWWLTQKLKCQTLLFMKFFISLVEQDIGFPLSHNKTVGPAQQLDFVGLTANLHTLCITLPADKVAKCLTAINSILESHASGAYVTVKELERCAGTLNFASQALPCARPFLQRVYALQWIANDHKTDRTIPDLVAQDLQMFHKFFTDPTLFSNNVPFLRRLGLENSALEIKADAAGNPLLGFGFFLPATGQWGGHLWSETSWFNQPILHSKTLIFQLELFAIITAFKQVAHTARGSVVLLRSDNESVVAALNSLTSTLEAPMQLLRDLTLTCMSLQILIVARHISGKENWESDLISRAKVASFIARRPASLNRRIVLSDKLWPPSWTPSTLRRSSGWTNFRPHKQGPSPSSLKSAKIRTSRWS